MNYSEKLKKLKNNINFKKLSIFFIISIVFFGVLVNMEYATDTYTVFSSSAKTNVLHFLGSGRFVTAFATLMIRILNLGEYAIYLLSFILSILSLTFSLYEMEQIIHKDIKSDKISIILSTLIILNVFIIELFMFIEKGILILSILLSVLALKYFIKYLETKRKKNIALVLVLMFLANGCYQGTVGIFIALVTVYILKNSKNFKEFFINNVIAVICYAIPAFIDLVIGKIFAGSRISGNIDLLQTIEKITNGTKNMVFTYNLIPKYMYFTLVVLTVVTLIYKIITKKDTIKEKVLNILGMGYISIVVIMAAVLPQAIQNTEAIWMVARSTYTFASLIGILLLYLFINFNMNNDRTFNLQNIIIIISLLFLVTEYYNFTKIEISRYKLNNIDKEVTLQIIKEINKYEKETGKAISKIAIYQDKEMRYTYNDIFVTGDMNVKAYSSDWATKSILQYYLHRELENAPKNDELELKFKQHNWDEFNNEQLIFKDDTLHICCY